MGFGDTEAQAALMREHEVRTPAAAVFKACMAHHSHQLLPREISWDQRGKEPQKQLTFLGHASIR